jgi:dipeptidyl aminopeptidase/acylaminoacyl peptidase
MKGILNLFNRHARTYTVSILILVSSFAVPLCPAQQAKKPFTVADEIGLTLFENQFAPENQAVRFSPDGQYFAVYSERGRLDVNRVEGTLRFYRSQEIKDFLENSNQTKRPSCVWIVSRSTDKRSGVIKDWRWLIDSSGVAYLEHDERGKGRLVLADLRRKTIEPMTSTREGVEAFDFRDRRHYVYTTTGSAGTNNPQPERQAIVGTGRSLYEMLFPGKAIYPMLSSIGAKRYTNLWAVVDGRRFEVRKRGTPPSIGLDHLEGELLLSPDGRSVLAALAVPEVPKSWETLYPSPSVSDAYRIETGKVVHQFVLITLRTGSIRSLTGAPVSEDAGLWAPVFALPSWSKDGQAVLLPGTFIKSNDNVPSRPCVAVVDLAYNSRSCVEKLGAMWPEPGVEQGLPIANVSFVNGDRERVLVSFCRNLGQWSIGETAEYRRATDSLWKVVARTMGDSEAVHGGLKVTIQQGLNQPPVLVATNKKFSRVIWDPNPELKSFALGNATVYNWKDREGRQWKGGLYKPVDYQPGKRYPLVIQTHGFVESEFRPSGIYPSGFAARALAGAGIAVLQSEDAAHCVYATPQEHSCAVSGYEAAVGQLISEGLVDAARIGIIGFSHSGGYVMEELTTGSLHIKAALNEDTDLVDFFRYMAHVDYGEEVKPQEFDTTVGAKPFGQGLQLWLRRSPSFNLDKITAPLRIVIHGPDTFLLDNWQTYSGLRYLHKPVDLILMNPDNVKGMFLSEHVLSTPALRIESQGGSVDWFRFWLQDYEDPDPRKTEQYKRWRELRNLQEENASKAAVTRSAQN